jgi:replicative DNA helicase
MSQLIDPNIARQFDRLPPCDIEAEMCLLGSLLRLGDDKATAAKVRQLVETENFYQADHQAVFDAICRLHDAGKPVDLVSVRAKLEQLQVLKEVGGVPGSLSASVWLRGCKNSRQERVGAPSRQ